MASTIRWPLRGVPAEIQELPSASGNGKVTLCVEGFGVGPEVKPAAVALEAELAIGEADVCLGDDRAVGPPDRVLRNDSPQRRIREAQS